MTSEAKPLAGKVRVRRPAVNPDASAGGWSTSIAGNENLLEL